jgi:hypothetical protein
MYRHRNLDIVIATIVAILGGLAAAKHLPGQITIPLGIGLFFAPGYLWSEAILSHRIPGFERAMFSAGMALIFPILGGFLFYGLHIPLKQTAWIGLLVVLTLLGVVATAIQRLRDMPDDQAEGQQPGSGRQPARQGGSVALNSFVYGLAAVVAIGAIGYSVKSAETQKFPPRTALSMTPVVDNTQAQNIAQLSNNPLAQQTASQKENDLQAAATKAHLVVTDYEYAPEQYELKLLQNGKVTNTWKFTLADGQTWQTTIAWTNFQSKKPVALLADLYKLPNTSTPYRYTTNGTCMPAANLKALPTVLRAEDPCDVKL